MREHAYMSDDELMFERKLACANERTENREEHIAKLEAELDRLTARVAELEAKLKESRGVVASLLLATELMQDGPKPEPEAKPAEEGTK